MEQENFTVLENKAIGRNISMYRKIRGIKASDIAERIGMKEASYTRYERGEASITVDIIQQVAEILKVDPLMMLSVSPANIIENGSNSPNSIVALHALNCQTTNEQQNEMILKFMETAISLNQRLLSLLEDKTKL